MISCDPGLSEGLCQAWCPLGWSPVLTAPPVASGYPTPRLYWFKDGQPLTASAHIRMSDRRMLHTLEVVAVTGEDAGQYSAYISNAVGAAYSSARLLVRGGCPARWQGLASTPGLLWQAWKPRPSGHCPCVQKPQAARNCFPESVCP